MEDKITAADSPPRRSGRPREREGHDDSHLPAFLLRPVAVKA